MNPVIGKCPVCDHELVVSRLDCSNCGTEIGGQFSLGRLYRLDADQIRFVEIFVKNRGNAYKVGEEIEMPYSAVRARLTEIIRALGYDSPPEARAEPAVTPERRKAVLDELAQGHISTEEAVRLLQEA